MEKKSLIGNPKGAGRKPAADPKQTINLFIERSKIELLGGKNAARQLAYDYLAVVYQQKHEAVLAELKKLHNIKKIS